MTAELTDGYDTMVGERGVRLSGGQRQRIGIARALYHDLDILVMYEATSALDSITETAVKDAIHTLMHTKTTIMIAHRISTLPPCDRIYVMDAGEFADERTHDDLIDRSKRFRGFAKRA